MREYEDIDRQEERNRPHHDLHPKTNPTQTEKRPGKAIESRRLQIFHEFFSHNRSYLFRRLLALPVQDTTSCSDPKCETHYVSRSNFQQF
jgi:hypothetical protein